MATVKRVNSGYGADLACSSGTGEERAMNETRSMAGGSARPGRPSGDCPSTKPRARTRRRRSRGPIGVLLADDDPIVLSGLRSALGGVPRVKVLGEANDGAPAVALAQRHHPDVVFMDVAMPELDGLEATKRITRQLPGVRVIIFTELSRVELYREALDAGACGYLVKTATAAELQQAFRGVISGGICLSAEIADSLVKQRLSEAFLDVKGPLGPLNDRQRELLRLIAAAKTTRAIAGILGISPRTVRRERAKLMACLSIRDIPNLVRFALRKGLIEQDG